jgi:UDP:flavonoid glycosyltransferase YjiC (YdhE family)
MASILISTMPATGHVNPALPLATALVERDHQVLWHTGDAFRDRVTATGARFAPFVHTPDFDRIPLRPDDGAKGMAAGVSIMRRLFVDRMAGQVADYQEILGTSRPTSSSPTCAASARARCTTSAVPSGRPSASTR